MHQYLDGLMLTCEDAACESVNVGVAEKNVIAATFGVRSITCDDSLVTDPNTPVWDGSAPLVGTYCHLIHDGGSMDMTSMDFSLTTRRSRGGINTSGIGELPWLGEFEATAKLSPRVEDLTPLTEFFNGSQVNVEMTNGSTVGNILHTELAGLRREGPDIGEEEGDYTWDDPLSVNGGIYIGLF